MSKYIYAAVFLGAIANDVYAIGNMHSVKIKSIFVRESRVDIYLENPHNNPTACSNATELVILANEFENSTFMYTAALAAHMAQRPITGYIADCHDNRAKLSAISIDQ